LKQIEFRSCEKLIAHLRARQDVWEPALGGPQGFNAAIAGLLEVNAQHEPGDHWYTERLKLTPQAADKLTMIQAQKTLWGRNPQAYFAEQSQLDVIFADVLSDPTSWTPEKFAAYEVVKETAAFGPEFFLVASVQTEATSVTRYLYQAKALENATDNTQSAAAPRDAVQAVSPDTVPDT
jgi:hypothetical protein